MVRESAVTSMNTSFPTRYRALLALSACVGLIASCVREYSLQVPTSATIEAIDWPDTVTETDTATLRVRIRDASGDVVSGTNLAWASSDPSIVDVARGVSSDSTLQARLSAQLRAAMTARRTGSVVITVTTPDSGAIGRAELRRTIVVAQHWVTISAGYFHSCGTTVRREAYCWGGGLRFLGNGSAAGSIVPSKVIDQSIPFDTVSAGWEQSCGATHNPGDSTYIQLRCWGFNPFGAVGNGGSQDEFIPVFVSRGPSFKTFQAAFGFTCGLSEINTAACWGDNSAGQLGNVGPFETCGGAQTACERSPTAVVVRADKSPLSVRSLSGAESHACAVSLDNAVYCWGSNTRGNLGNGGADPSQYAVRVSSSVAFSAVSAGAYHTCALSTGSHIYCWGTNLFGELGGAQTGDTCDGLSCNRAPAVVPGNILFRAISVRGRSSCAISADSLAYCWGLNDHGQLGVATTATCAGSACTATPTLVAGLPKVRAISVGDRHVCAVAATGVAYCGGQKSDGRLGTGTRSDTPRPARVTDPR
jgi:alpha-tubulin suppressor-like RCC1 family protein